MTEEPVQDYGQGTYKPPTDFATFEQETALLPWLMAETIMEGKGYRVYEGKERTSADGKGPKPAELAYFIALCDVWIRWFYANDPKWKRVLTSTRNHGNYGRDWCYMWIGQWAYSFLRQGYKQFRERHQPLEQYLMLAAVPDNLKQLL